VAEIELIEQLRDVFADEICFEVDELTRFAFPEIRYFERVGYDPDPEALWQDVRYREADAVNCYRAFVDDVSHYFLRRFNFKNPVLTNFLPTCDPTDSVDVARHKVAAHGRIRTKRAFKVHERTCPKLAKVGFVPCFLQQIELCQL